MYRFFVGVALAAAFASGAHAADQPVYAPPPAWVRQVPIPPPDRAEGGAAVQQLLRDQQMQFGPDGDSFYFERATKVLSASGLPILGNIILSWQPSTETLTIHRIEIIRDGHTIDLLDGGKKVTVLRRETDLELAMLDGSLTATIQPEGLRVGDVVHLAYTIEDRDPVLEGRSEGFWELGELRAGRAHVRAVWPRSKTMAWRATEGLAKPSLTEEADVSELTIDMADAQSPTGPAGAPARYGHLGQLQISEFKAWSEAAALLAPLYEKASTVGPGSPVLAQAKQIEAQTSDPGQRAMAALELVQNDVRYLFLGMDHGGLTPADADLTWRRRFGDCKAKTVLLLALLRELGIQAEPALVSTTGGDGLDERLPSLGLFDHVLVRAVIGGKIYWLDGTRTGDRSLADIAVPGFHWALPLKTQGGALERLVQAPYTTPRFDSVVTLDATGGLDKPASAHVEYVLRGDGAIAMHEDMVAAGPAGADKALKKYWRDAISWIEPQKVGFAYDEASATATVTEDGAAQIDWARSDGGARDFIVNDSSLGWDVTYNRDNGPQLDAPYAVEFPMYKKWTDIVRLPANGAGFSLVNGDSIDRTVAGVRFMRTAAIDKGVVTIVAEWKALQPEFPSTEAKAAAAAMREMADYDVVVRAGDAAATSANSPQLQTALTGLLDAAKKAESGDSAGVYAVLKPLVSTPGYGQIPTQQRAAGFYLLAWSALAQKDYAASHDAAVQGIALDDKNQLVWIIRMASAQELRDWDDLALSIGTLARRWPAALKDTPDAVIFSLDTHVHGERRFDALLALHDTHWTPKSESMDASNLWLTLVEGYLEKGNLKDATAVAHDITAHRAMIIMHADKRFDTIVKADPAFFNVGKAIDRDLARRRADIVAHPSSLEAVNALAFALLERGQAADALALAQDALAKSHVDPDSKPQFDDVEDQLNRTLEFESMALRDLGRTDESLEVQQRGAAHAEHGGYNVSQTLDLAERFNTLGRPQDALDALEDFDPRRASPYGVMVWRQDLVCAYVQLKNAAKAGESLQYMKAHARDGVLPLQGALVCAGDADGLAKALIESLEDPERRATTLLGMQTDRDSPAPQSAWTKERQAFEHTVWARPDVRAAIDKYGRIESYPIALDL